MDRDADHVVLERGYEARRQRELESLPLELAQPQDDPGESPSLPTSALEDQREVELLAQEVGEWAVLVLVSVLIVGFDVQVADVDLGRGLAPRLGDGLDRTLVRATGFDRAQKRLGNIDDRRLLSVEEPDLSVVGLLIEDVERDLKRLECLSCRDKTANRVAAQDRVASLVKTSAPDSFARAMIFWIASPAVMSDPASSTINRNCGMRFP